MPNPINKKEEWIKNWEVEFDKYFCGRCEAIRSVCFHSGTKQLT